MFYRVYFNEFDTVKTDVHEIEYSADWFEPNIKSWKYAKYISNITLSYYTYEQIDLIRFGIQRNCIITINPIDIRIGFCSLYNKSIFKYYLKSKTTETTSADHLTPKVIKQIKRSKKIHMINKQDYDKWKHQDPRFMRLMYQEYCRYTFDKTIFHQFQDSFDLDLAYNQR